MGEHNVSIEHDSRQAQAFVKSLLADVSAIERMIETDQFERGVRRIGAEQEMFLIDRAMRPAPVGMEVLKKANDYRLTTEIGKFNIEVNLSPRPLAGSGLREMEEELAELIAIGRAAARSCDADVLLAGVLPTVRQSDLTLDNLTPVPRYFELNREMTRLRGGAFNIHIKGLDELHTVHDNLMFEACCCSFQVHSQVEPEEFARLYNLAQAISAPLLAVAANSPLLVGHRLWRWNRPCYGVHNSVAHLRIEHRSMPAGPSVVDEMANAAFFYGLMTALSEEYGEIEKLMAFDDAKNNFFAAARHGLKAPMTWISGGSRKQRRAEAGYGNGRSLRGDKNVSTHTSTEARTQNNRTGDAGAGRHVSEDHRGRRRAR
jgi:hypothetical protein